MRLARLHIASKLWIFIVLVILSICAVAVVGLVRSAGILAEGRSAQMNAVELVQISTEWTGLTQTNAVRNQAIIVTPGTSASDAFKDAVTATSAQISELQKKIDGMPLTAADKAQMQKIGDLRKTVIDLRDKARKVKTDGNEEEAIKMMNAQYLPAMDSYLAAQREFVEMQKSDARKVQVGHRGAPPSQHRRHLGRFGRHHCRHFFCHRLVGALHSRAPGARPMNWLRALPRVI